MWAEETKAPTIVLYNIVLSRFAIGGEGDGVWSYPPTIVINCVALSCKSKFSANAFWLSLAREIRRCA